MAASNCENQRENEEGGGSKGEIGQDQFWALFSSPHYWYVVSDFLEPQERPSRQVRQPLQKQKEIPIPILSKIFIPKSAHILLSVVI